ncbi:HEAT repeat domain-containing protein [Methylomonas sp. MO1]|uniref:HEAT repeat domain-containing protein n=1 Tax=Methylomonas sp. MO1 TaxID=3073619 RepID=UPI0028A54EAB|nr:HEAT repeat domain-containing protein [Methylomonas sp. MO1]MDT4291908.1 HEAT repeat domain-containing protein [Methylomonas sp. MO1]
MIELTALKPFASIAGKIGGSLFTSILAKKLTEKGQQKQLQLCVDGLCEEWLMSVLKSLQSMDYEEAALQQLFPHYSDDLEQFVKDEKVAEELLKPLTEDTSKYHINASFLAQRWKELELQELPDEFDMEDVCRLYVRRVQKQSVITPELRQLYLAQLAQESTNYLQAIRGYWPDFDLERYKERLTTRYKTLDLSALTPPARDDIDDVRILLQDVFIPQTVRENLPPRELPKEFWLRLQCQGEVDKDLPDSFESKEFNWAQQTAKPVLNIFHQEKLVLLGDPGSGKSSLARFLLLSCLTPPNNPSLDWLAPLKGHLPLLIELRAYIAAVEAEHAENFLEYLHYLGKSEGYAINHQELQTQLKTQPALVMFDGLDEIFDLSKRGKITEEIIGFAHDYKRARILVTSRIVGYDGLALRSADFKEYTLQDLDKTQIQTFADGWFKLVFRDKPDEVNSRIERIQQAISHSPAIAQLAGNPLLLTIIAIIAKHQELPRERVLLYDHAVRVLCHHWDVTGHKINDAPADFMREADKLELLRRVAVRMLKSDGGLKGNAIYADDLQQEIEAYLTQRWQLPVTDSARIGQAIIEQLRARNFILCFYGVGVYGFVHRTFLEYFCALDIVQSFEKKKELSLEQLIKLFKGHYQDDVWHEIMRLICGMVDAKFAGKLIESILPKREQAFENSAELTLAIQCLAEIADLLETPETAKQVLACLCGWFERNHRNRKSFEPNVEELFEENALPAIERIGKNWVGRDEFVDWLKLPNKQTNGFSGSYCFGRIVFALWSNHIEIEQYLINLTQEEEISIRHMTFDALARCFKESTANLLKEQITTDMANVCIWTLTKHYQDLPETFPLIKQCLQDEDRDVRRAAVSALTEHYRDQAETFPLIKQCLQAEHSDVRQAAVSALAEHYRDQAETFPLIKQCLQAEHSDVRQAAVSALAEHYRDQAETFPLIKQCLQAEHSDVRRAAVSALTEHYRDQAETFPLIKQCLQDEDSEVCLTAVSALTEHYRDQAETFPLIKQCLQDEDSEVRSAAVSTLTEHYRDQAETFPLIKQCLQDEDSEVRRTAVSALAKHYRDQAETFPLIKQCLQDEDSEVRRTAVSALAKHYRDQAETFPLIKQCLQAEHSEVRSAAVSALTEHYRDQAETFPLIKQCLQAEHSEVRSAAVSALTEHYRDQAETFPLIKQCLQAEHSEVRSAAVSALTEHYRDQAETFPLIKQCLQDEDSEVRRTAVSALAQKNYAESIKRRLLSRDLDNLDPWLDILEAITQVRIEKAAKRLNLSAEEIRQHYEEISVDIPLILEWKQ